MAAIDVKHDLFTCHQNGEWAVITLLKGAKRVLTNVKSKEDFMSTLEIIKDSHEIKGLAILYSGEYSGNDEYKRFLLESFEEKHSPDQSRHTVTYKFAIIQFLKIIRTYPIPIVGGMNGDIGPDSLGLNLALDLRIATNKTSFLHPNLQLGFPPSALLSCYLVQSFGPYKTTEIMLTKFKISAREALELGLITQISPVESFENDCFRKLSELASIPNHTFLETRSILQPSIDEIKSYVDTGFEGSVRSFHKMKSLKKAIV